MTKFDDEFMATYGFCYDPDEGLLAYDDGNWTPVKQRDVDAIIENLTAVRGNGDFENEVAELQYDLQMAKELLQDAKEYIQLLSAHSNGEMN